jgi:transposase InsO family protein
MIESPRGDGLALPLRALLGDLGDDGRGLLCKRASTSAQAARHTGDLQHRQGSQFTGHAITGVLNDHKIRISMDGRGRAMDNIMIERLWRTIKCDDIYLKEYETVEQLLAGLRNFFDYYNNERPHSSVGDRTPAEVYFGAGVSEEAASMSLVEQLHNKKEAPVYTFV